MGRGRAILAKGQLDSSEFGSNTAAEHGASDEKIRPESREGGLRTDQLGRQQGASNVNFNEQGNDMTISCRGQLLRVPSPSLYWAPTTQQILGVTL